MTTKDEEIRREQDKVNGALEAAEQKVNWAHRLAKEWRESRDANNFRAMIREIGREGLQRG